MLYTWKNEYSVGVSRFDNHHKKLFDIANQLHEMMKSGKGAEVIEPTLRELIDYTKYHLDEEEKAMERIAYSGISSHKRAHSIFTEKLNGALVEIEKGRAQFVVVKVSKTVIDWLIDHIFVVDQKYTAEMNAAGIS
ncbi:MAG: bacteriohemerythrin [Candidatus Electrothrix aestuarii]|jgi:hemerythrin-like metal-binding protein|uniref:Bacteriohemerythrin n=1 Tax=Candidatus Electrothrix aestuarii TaxID=3062594 RepID=A0AAU8LXE3_9BACT|nr:bacteriohemerythrin [Candidatus Electrothrix aestuarii]WPD22931.1 MAG: bacteriohemerythrin [Candidatus Electrothrix sp. GW3-3]